MFGRKQSESTRSLISDKLLGKKFTKEHKENLSKSWTDFRKTHVRKGFHFSEEHSRNLSIALRNSKKFQRLIRSTEHRRKRRLGIIRHIEKVGKCKPMRGKNEIEFLNLQEQKSNHKIIRQYRIKDLGYWVDGYCKETNTVYEIYELRHKSLCMMKHDNRRQKEIQKFLKCKFVIIWDNSH